MLHLAFSPPTLVRGSKGSFFALVALPFVPSGRVCHSCTSGCVWACLFYPAVGQERHRERERHLRSDFLQTPGPSPGFIVPSLPTYMSLHRKLAVACCTCNARSKHAKVRENGTFATPRLAARQNGARQLRQKMGVCDGLIESCKSRYSSTEEQQTASSSAQKHM